MPKVKICGNTNTEDARIAAELGADYLGFIFTESKRKVSLRQASKIIEAMPQFRNFVAVFFNQPKTKVESIVSELGIKHLQFHGDEPSRYCRYFSEKGYKVIKTFRIKDAMSLKRIDEYNEVDAFLFDTYSKSSPGGTGEAFDWNLIQAKPYICEKLFLAGGLGVENVEKAIQVVQPFAVDVASGVEKEPGKKDHDLLAKFIRLAKEGTGRDAHKGSVHS